MKVARTVWSGGKTREGSTYHYIKFAKLCGGTSDQGIDCVIRRGEHDYVDLQIKARSNDCQPTDAGSFAAMEIPKTREKYFFLFYSAQAETYWISPRLNLLPKLQRTRRENQLGHIALT